MRIQPCAGDDPTSQTRISPSGGIQAANGNATADALSSKPEHEGAVDGSVA
jgi:hypothetical protein